MLCGTETNNTNVFKKKLARTTFLSRDNVLTAVLAATMLAAVPNAATAKPVHDSTPYGDVKIDCNCNKMDVHVKSDKAIINWKSFSIAANEHVEFHQRAATSVAVNRVVTNTPSQIMGKLTANGRIVLINQNGILFGAGSQVNVGGLIATTSDIDQESFKNSNLLNFNIKAPAGSEVVNLSKSMTIKEGGMAAFVAPNVRNEGTIYGDASRITLAGGESFTIDLYGDGLVNLEVANTPSKVEHKGNIINPQGTVILTTNDAQDIISNVVNTDNIIVAQNARIVGKNIILDGNSTGNVNVAGKLDAAGELSLSSSKRNGGTVTVKGHDINIQDTAQINANGAIAGKGGDVAIVAGNKVIQKGKIDASGGLGSTGGTIEISGKTFVLDGDVKAGYGGTVIIGSENIQVRNGSENTPAENSIYEQWIEAQSQGGTNVVLTASQLIHVDAIQDNVIQGGSGNISLLANKGGSTTGRIEFAQDTNAIQTTSGDITLAAGSGGIKAGKLISDNMFGEAGTVSLTTTNGGDIAARKVSAKGLNNAHVMVASDGAVNLHTAKAVAKSYNDDAHASVTVSSANGNDITLGSVKVASTATRNNMLTSSVESNANANITSSGKITVSKVNVNALAHVNDLVPDFFLATTPDVKANASAVMKANDDIHISDKTNVSAKANGTSKPLLSGRTASATSLVDIHSGGYITNTALTANSAKVKAEGNGYDNVNASTHTNIHGEKGVSLNTTHTNASAKLTGKTNTKTANITADNTAFITSKGDIAMSGNMLVAATATSDSAYADTLDAVADATLQSYDADVTLNAPIHVTAQASGAGNDAGNGNKPDAKSLGKLTVLSDNGDITANSDAHVNALTTITGNGYGKVEAKTEALYHAGNSLFVNNGIGSTAETRTDGVTVDEASAIANMHLKGEGIHNNGSVLLNGHVFTAAKTSNSTDNATSLLHVSAKDDNIIFVDGINNPRAYTRAGALTPTERQGRYTSSITDGTHTSSLILLQAPVVPSPTSPNAPATPLNPMFISPLERFLLSVSNSGVADFSTEMPYIVNMNEAKLSLLGSRNTANLSPEQLGSLEPAAGGMTGDSDSSVNCANSYLDSGYGTSSDAATCTLAQAF